MQTRSLLAGAALLLLPVSANAGVLDQVQASNYYNPGYVAYAPGSGVSQYVGSGVTIPVGVNKNEVVIPGGISYTGGTFSTSGNVLSLSGGFISTQDIAVPNLKNVNTASIGSITGSAVLLSQGISARTPNDLNNIGIGLISGGGQTVAFQSISGTTPWYQPVGTAQNYFTAAGVSGAALQVNQTIGVRPKTN